VESEKRSTKVERGPAALDRFKNIVFQTIFKELKK